MQVWWISEFGMTDWRCNMNDMNERTVPGRPSLHGSISRLVLVCQVDMIVCSYFLPVLNYFNKLSLFFVLIRVCKQVLYICFLLNFISCKMSTPSYYIHRFHTMGAGTYLANARYQACMTICITSRVDNRDIYSW